MKNKKLWIFIGIVILILILNYIFGWSSYLGDTDNLKFLEKMVQDNLALAIGIYMAVTIVGSVVLALRESLLLSLQACYSDRPLEPSAVR